MTALSGQPYPQQDGWQDLTPFLANGWSQRGLVPCGFKADGNNLIVSAAVWIGDTNVVAEGLPDLLTGVGARILNGFLQSGDAATVVGVRWESDGRLTMQSGHFDIAASYASLVVSGEVPR